MVRSTDQETTAIEKTFVPQSSQEEGAGHTTKGHRSEAWGPQGGRGKSRHEPLLRFLQVGSSERGEVSRLRTG